MTNDYKKQTKKLGWHANIYLAANGGKIFLPIRGTTMGGLDDGLLSFPSVPMSKLCLKKKERSAFSFSFLLVDNVEDIRTT